VRVFQQANGGQLSAWVRAAGEVHGEIVALMDSDDLWKPHYLERLAAQYARDPSVDLIYCNMELFGIRQGLFHRSRRDRDLGLSILMGAFINRWQGSATSAISLRAPLFRRLVDLPPEQVKQWKSRPDDCLLCGADILGAHKYYVAEPLVMHREHAENALAGYGKSRLAKMRYVVRNEQMLEHYRRLMHITPRWQRLAKHEFKTRQRPGFGEFLDYSRMLGDAPMSFSKRLSHRVSMLAHYLRSLLSGK
jgi:glycosyltransferase involved in cell wall biosynthesis